MDKVGLINLFQIQEMAKHKWIESQKKGFDLGITADFEWITKYAKDVRTWVDTIPFECIRCGGCSGWDGTNCCQEPFKEERLRFLELKKQKEREHRDNDQIFPASQ